MFKCGGKVPGALPGGLEGSRIEAHLRRALGGHWRRELHPGFRWGLLPPEVTRCLQRSPAGWGACVCAVGLGIRKWDRLIPR